MTASGKPTGPNYKLGVSLGQTSPGLYSGTNYKVKLGFQYIYPIVGFKFSISETSIDFGSLSPTNPVTRTNTLTVSNGSGGYTVTANEDHELKETTSAQLIPDTTCDNGSCSETTSAPWTNTLTYGFGYRCDNVNGTDCNSGFSDATSYKQFANKEKSETDANVMTNSNVSRSKSSKNTYKVNIAGTQAAGAYTNKITYIATPTF